MKVVSIADIVEVNKRLVGEGFACKVHLRDACGRQTMWLELYGDSRDKGAAQQEVRKIFAERGYGVEFDATEGVNFWVK